MAEKIIPAVRQRSDSARFLILRPAHTVPSVDIDILALQGHLLACNHVVFGHL